MGVVLSGGDVASMRTGISDPIRPGDWLLLVRKVPSMPAMRGMLNRYL